eukprot:138530-Rhodomonas_salina.3
MTVALKRDQPHFSSSLPTSLPPFSLPPSLLPHLTLTPARPHTLTLRLPPLSLRQMTAQKRSGSSGAIL